MKRGKQIFIRLTEKELKKLRDDAVKAGHLALSEYVRAVVLGEFK